MAKKYDIMVFETTSNGIEKPHPENGIMANSPTELINIYKMCGQKIQIVREYEDIESQNYGKPNYLDPSDVQMYTDNGGTGLMKISDEESKKIEEFQTKKETPSQVNQSINIIDNKTQQYIKKEPVKYITIGGIKCKIENGKFYQKQWLTLSDDEASEIRIISNKNNKICPLKDKHIEIMKWVLVEESENDDESAETRSLLNG